MEDNYAPLSTPTTAGLRFLKEQPALASNPFIGQGLCLRAVFELLLAEQNGDSVHWEGMTRALQDALELQDNLPLSSSLFRGVSGIGWAIQQCPPLIAKPDIQEFLIDLDELLLDGILEAENPNFDIVNGVAGIMVYAMSRERSISSSSRLWEALELMCARSISAWLALNHANDLQSRGTQFQRNLGVAHGVPGMLTMMINASRSGHISATVADLALQAFEQLTAYAIRGGGGRALFPETIESNREARLAWCYGALGLADAYRNAALLDPSHREMYASLVKGALHQYETGEHRMVDASLCHGLAGAHFYFHVFAQSDQLSEELRRRCKDASVSTGDSLERINSGTADQPCFLWHVKGKRIETSSFLEGTSGVVLAKHAVSRRDAGCAWGELLGTYLPKNGKRVFMDEERKEKDLNLVAVSN
ncbi:lanthionine synthetase LanC family protein [Stenotrophomonas maltophilia]|uniref:lanthionine synthetase LanC family protein n=1 Tax=Stenotrophomonas maltophilia TaxID=40324 RepID=UPI0025522DCC|nr:lanthionine synthetase LanC family protein [Stenotrophomonas maltophilia]